MPLRVRFIGADPPRDHAEIAGSLAHLADDGWLVTVRHPDDGSEALGWWVSLDQPGRHLSFRIRVGASPAEWGECVRKQLPSSN